ncbi:MAG: hypothetical protein PVF28_04545 [Thioalkalispiraceae bacterium]
MSFTPVFPCRAICCWLCYYARRVALRTISRYTGPDVLFARNRCRNTLSMTGRYQQHRGVIASPRMRCL